VLALGAEHDRAALAVPVDGVEGVCQRGDQFQVEVIVGWTVELDRRDVAAAAGRHGHVAVTLDVLHRGPVESRGAGDVTTPAGDAL